MKRLQLASALALAASLTQAAAAAQRAPGAGLSGRYSEEQMTATRWGISVTRSTVDRARDIALYRAAVLARAAGFSHVQVVAFRMQAYDFAHVSPRGAYYGSTPLRTAFAQIELVSEQDAPLRCEASVADTPYCATASVELVFAQVAPRVGRADPAQIEADVVAAVARNERARGRR